MLGREVRDLSKLITRLYQWYQDQKGQGMVEYGLIIALVAIALIVALGAMSGAIGGTFNKITGQMPQ